METAFPLAERFFKKLNSKMEEPALVLCISDWTVPLKKELSNPHFSFKEWEDDNIEGILPGISGYKTILVCLPEGEDRAATLLRERIGEGNVILRLLRDVVLKVSLSLGGRLKPQKNWETCPPDSPSFFIFAIPRSGSTFFCDILGKTMMLGHPKEHLVADLLPVFFNTDLTFNEWLRALVKYSFTPNGYSSTKLISHLFLDILANYKARPGVTDDLVNFIRSRPVIYLLRRNKVRQAVSLLIAKKTAVWHLNKEKNITSSRQDEAIDESPEKIANSIKWFNGQEKELEDFFSKAGIVPHTYFYEDFADNSKAPGIFKEIGQFLNVDFPEVIPEPKYLVMSDEQNEKLVRQYYKYLDLKMRASEFPQDPLSASIMSSMMAEMESLDRKGNSGITVAKPSKKKWWKLF